MNVLVTGANGQLGRSLRALAPTSGDRFIFTDVSSLPGEETVYLDITDANAVNLFCESERVDCIVNCAAYTAVDKAEDDSALCDLLNRVGPANLAGAAAGRGALMLHISTDYIFGGDSSIPYREEMDAAPLGVYGATKYQGELAVRESGAEYVIIRTGWLYSPYGRNFVKTMLELTASRREVRVVCDQVGTPTYALDLAGFILRVLEKPVPGIYNYSGEGVCSWYDFACAIRDLSGHSGCEVLPCSSADYPSKVRRPHYSVLDKSRAKAVYGVRIPHWFHSLKRCLNEIH